MLYSALSSKLFLFSSAVSFSLCFCSPLPLLLPSFLFGSFFLLTVSRAPVLNSLSKLLTSGSIVCPLIITYHLPSAHYCMNVVLHWAPLFSESPHGLLIVQRCSLYKPVPVRISRVFTVYRCSGGTAVTSYSAFKKLPLSLGVLKCFIFMQH